MVPARTLKFLLVSFACVAVLAACARTSSGPTPEELRLEEARLLAKENPIAVANILKTWVNGEAG